MHKGHSIRAMASIHEKLVQFEHAPSGSYIAIASQVEDDDHLGSPSPSSSRFSLALTSLREKTTYSIIEESKLEENGLGGIRENLGKSEFIHVLLKFKNECVFLQCVDEGTSYMKRAKALVCGRLLVSLIPFPVVVIYVTEPTQVNDRLIRSKLACWNSSSSSSPSSTPSTPSSPFPPRQREASNKTETQSNNNKTDTIDFNSPDVPQDASTFSDSPQLDNSQSSDALSSSMPDTPFSQAGDNVDRVTFVEEMDSFDESMELHSFVPFLVKKVSATRLSSFKPSFSSSSSSGSIYSQQEFEAPFPIPPDREEQRREAERKRLGVPTPVQEDSGEDRSSVGSQLMTAKGLTLGGGYEKALPPLPSRLSSLYSEDSKQRFPQSYRSSTYSWVLEHDQSAAIQVESVKEPVLKNKLNTRDISRNSIIDDLERDRLEFLNWKKEQEEAILAKEREKEKLRRLADEAKRERLLKKLMKEQQAWIQNEKQQQLQSSPISSDFTSSTTTGGERGGESKKQGAGGGSGGTSGARSVASTTAGRKKKSRPPPLSPPPNVPPPRNPIHSAHRLSFPGEEPKTPISGSGSTSTHESILASLTGIRHRERDEDWRTDRLAPPIITLEGHIRRRAVSHGNLYKSSANKTSQRPEFIELDNPDMPPFQASIEVARRKAKRLEEKGLEGESWLTRQNRQRTISGKDIEGIPVGNGWNLTEVEGVKVSPDTMNPSHSSSSLIAEKHAEALLAHQQQIAFQLSQLQRRERDLWEAEGLQRAKWAREQAQLSRLDAFERSQCEALERRRREQVEQLQGEEREEKLRLEQEQIQATLKIQEDKEYREKKERANRERKERMEEEEDRNRRREAVKKEKSKSKAEARNALRMQLETIKGPVLARGIITIQVGNGMKRVRRWFELERQALLLYPESKANRGSDTVLEMIPIEPGCITSLSDAFEELQLPHSLSLTYHSPNNQVDQTLLGYTEDEGVKEKLLVGLAFLSHFHLLDTQL